MRAFVAFELPSALRRETARRTSELRQRLPPARWVGPEALHLTLRFLGEVAEERLTELGAGLAGAFAAAPRLTLRLADAGCFPPRRPARVAWIGVRAEEGGEPLLALHRRVDAVAGEVLGLAAEERPFHPHVTLARCRRPWPRPAVEAWTETLAGPLGEPFRADSGSLMESRLDPRGARYRRLASFATGTAAGER